MRKTLERITMHTDYCELMEMYNTARLADFKVKEIGHKVPRCDRMPIDKLIQIIRAYSHFLSTAS